jgi:AmpE protein
MSLIVIVLVMGTEAIWRNALGIRPFQAVIDFAVWLQGRWGVQPWFNGPAGVLATVLPVMVAVGLVQLMIDAVGGFFGGLVGILFGATVLIAAIGKRGAEQEIADYQQALERGDFEGAYLHVRDLLRERVSPTPSEMNRLLIERLLVRNHERLLAILFWFALLGPAGAVLYRSTTQLKGLPRAGRAFGDEFMEAVFRLQAILDWIPARITALLYGLIGSFIDAMRQWRLSGAEWAADLYSSNQEVLISAGVGSLRLREHVVVQGETMGTLRHELQEALALTQRAVTAWIIAFALLTIASWLG